MVSLLFGKRRKLRLERVVTTITKWHMGSRALQGQVARACPRDRLTGLPGGPGEPGSRSSDLGQQSLDSPYAQANTQACFPAPTTRECKPFHGGCGEQHGSASEN